MPEFSQPFAHTRDAPRIPNIRRAVNRLLLWLVTAGKFCRADVILSIDPSSQAVPLGSPASFAVDISGLGNGTALGTYDLNVAFDPALLSYSSIMFGKQLDVLGLGDIQSVTAGRPEGAKYHSCPDPPHDVRPVHGHGFGLSP